MAGVGRDRYELRYAEDSVYSRVVALLNEQAPDQGVHLDLGCGYGAIAEKVAERGLTYLGLDVEDAGLADLRRRGFETAVVDLQDLDAAVATIVHALNGRPVASICLLDTLEHVTNGPELLERLHRLSAATMAPLVVSVPNVAHRDLAFKLLGGRWDYTLTGLLDSTHVVHHTESLLRAVTERAGWREVGSRDLVLEQSDQYFPADHVALAPASTLHQFLVQLRAGAGPHAGTNQFIRAYLPGRPSVAALVVDPRAGQDAPFLTVVVRTQGRRAATLRDALLCLQAQTNQDFEVMIAVHKASEHERKLVKRIVEELPRTLHQRVRVLVVDSGGRAHPLNGAFDAARGRYVAVLDDDDLVLAHWVQTFADRAMQGAGRVLRAVSAEQSIEPATWGDGEGALRATGSVTTPYPDSFDLIAHIERNHTPFMSYAFPRSIVRDFGVRFDESLNICEDWDFELRCALLIGVAWVAEVTSVYRRWAGGPSSATLHSAEEWRLTERAILAKIDAMPQLFPPGTLAAIREAVMFGEERAVRERTRYEQDVRELLERNAEVEEQALRMERSLSWRVTAPLRALTRLARRARF